MRGARSLVPTLVAPAALLRKLEREQYRAVHARSAIHSTDHFYSFCVTAHAMRDFVLEHEGVTTEQARAPRQDAWTKTPLLTTVGEIANSSKHFVLRKPNGAPKPIGTRRLSRGRGKVMVIYKSPDGRLAARAESAPSIAVALYDGRRLDLWTFTADVIKYWHDHLQRTGHAVRRQSFNSLCGA